LNWQYRRRDGTSPARTMPEQDSDPLKFSSWKVN
jgi:hypothetical protein